MERKTTHVRVDSDTRWALKIACAELDCTMASLLARVERGDLPALAVWQRAARFVVKRAREEQRK
jgi:hypothetical protein